MDKTKILDFIKKNAFALSCGIVVIAAVIGAFYPFNNMVADLSTRAGQEASQEGTIKGFTRPRHFPQVDPTKTTPVELPSFPNKDQVKVGQDAVKKLESESQASLNVLVSLNGDNVHPLLVPSALPLPPTETAKFTFADVYKRALSLDPTESGLGAPLVPPPVQANRQQPTPMAVDERLAAVRAVNLCNDVLRAGAPVDQKLLHDREAWMKTAIYDPRLIGDNSGAYVNQAEVTADMTADFLQLPDQMNAEIAARSHVYLDPSAFAVNSSMLSAANPQVDNIWFAQLSFWVQTDIARAVAAANANLDSVADLTLGAPDAPPVPTANGEPPLRGVAASPVKRILRLDMKPIPMYQFATSGGGPVSADETAALPPTFGASPTGRTSNKMYDVVPFRLTVDVEADHVNRFISVLTRDRLIYVYNQDVYTIEPQSLAPMGFLYGSKPVVRLVLSGEELLLRKWTVPLMPLRIQYLLGLATPPPGSKIQPLGGGDAANPAMPNGGPDMPPQTGM
jgi:hypothetical protein